MIDKKLTSCYVLLSGCFEPNSRPYACYTCGQRFSIKSSLTRHYRHSHPSSVDEVEKYYPKALKMQCQECLKIFNFGDTRHKKSCKGKGQFTWVENYSRSCEKSPVFIYFQDKILEHYLKAYTLQFPVYPLGDSTPGEHTFVRNTYIHLH